MEVDGVVALCPLNADGAGARQNRQDHIFIEFLPQKTHIRQKNVLDVKILIYAVGQLHNGEAGMIFGGLEILFQHPVCLKRLDYPENSGLVQTGQTADILNAQFPGVPEKAEDVEGTVDGIDMIGAWLLFIHDWEPLFSLKSRHFHRK